MEGLQITLDKLNWVWAKTYAKFSPHWYVMYNKGDSFLEGIRDVIDKKGADYPYKGKVYRVLILGEYRYWIMGTNRTATCSLNRTYMDDTKFDNLPNA